MENFLKSVCTDIYSKYKNDFDNTLVIFPNKRGGLFFSKYLGEINNQTVWSPEIITLSDLISELSGMHQADDITLIFKLYNTYKKYIPTDESFDDFYFWGEMLLNDFDDIDKYMVNAKDLFQNIFSIKEIDAKFAYLSDEQLDAVRRFWISFNPKRFSDNQKDFLKVWENLHTVYKEFNQQLRDENICYEGGAYRAIAESVAEMNTNDADSEKTSSEEHRAENSTAENQRMVAHKISNLKYKHIVFVGFNALNRCEEVLFDYLRDSGTAHFYWDYDKYYLDNKHHEAGLYMRKNLLRYPNAITDNFNDLVTNGKKVNFISVPSETGQAKVIAQSLMKINSDDYEKTAVVLADEGLLLPVLHSIPENIDKINVTMGYPAQNSTVAGFISHIIELQKTVKSDKGITEFYHKPVFALLNHQYIADDNSRNKVEELAKNKNAFIRKQQIDIDGLAGKIFFCPDNSANAGRYLGDILVSIFKKIDAVEEKNDIHKIEKEYIYNLFLNIKRLNSILEENKIEILTSTYYRIIEKLIKGLSIPFTGEPLEGIQVMGLMETRGLDFENLYVLSVNEGKLPTGGAASSYIPYNLRKGFGLPAIEHQDAMFSYYFYRLIQRAKNVNLLYCNKTDGMQTGEMSRFLHQLKYETEDYEGISINEYTVVNEINTEVKRDIDVKKDGKILEKLNELCCSEVHPLSPSAVNTLIECKLKFYYKYIAKIEEVEEITEDIDPPTFGNIFHDSMESIYSELSGKKKGKMNADNSEVQGRMITVDLLENALKSKTFIDDILRASFGKNYYHSDRFEISGRDSIIYDIIKTYIRAVLEVDKKYCPFNILSLEGKYRIPIKVKSNGKEQNVYLGGYIDRVDKVKDGIRVLDYKTGSDVSEFKNIEELFDSNRNANNKAVLQTFFYCMFYEHKFPTADNIIPGIYSVTDLFDSDFNYKIINKDYKQKINEEVGDYKAYKDELYDRMTELMEDLLSPDKDFTQTDNDKHCAFCPYKELCRR